MITLKAMRLRIKMHILYLYDSKVYPSKETNVAQGNSLETFARSRVSFNVKRKNQSPWVPAAPEEEVVRYFRGGSTNWLKLVRWRTRGCRWTNKRRTLTYHIQEAQPQSSFTGTQSWNYFSNSLGSRKVGILDPLNVNLLAKQWILPNMHD